MKKILLILMTLFAFGLQNVCAQDAPLKIVTNHPDFKIKVKRCAASGKTVVIDLILMNEGTNDVENIRVHGGIAPSGWGAAEIYDDEGNIYRGENILVKIANDKEWGVYSTSRFNIPTGVPMKLYVQVNGFSTSAESIARMKLYVDCPAWGINNNDKPVKFSNIPIIRD